MRRTQKLSGCDDKNCPRIDATDQPGMLAVQGHRVRLLDRWRTRHTRSRGERILLIGEDLLDQAAQARGYRRP